MEQAGMKRVKPEERVRTVATDPVRRAREAVLGDGLGAIFDVDQQARER